MNRRTAYVAGLAAALVAVAVPITISDLAAGSSGDDPLDQIRTATRRFRHVDSAIDAGYVQFFGCVHEPLAGSMGIHFVNGELAGDTEIDPTTPEALMYEVRPNGQLALTGVEYVVFQEGWDAEHDEPPSLFGEQFIAVESDNRYGIPAFYELHAWAWKPNPTGDFTDWNPRVICQGTEGHQHAG